MTVVLRWAPYAYTTHDHTHTETQTELTRSLALTLTVRVWLSGNQLIHEIFVFPMKTSFHDAFCFNFSIQLPLFTIIIHQLVKFVFWLLLLQCAVKQIMWECVWQQQLANELIVRRFLPWDKAMSYYSPTRMELKNIAADHAWVGSRSRATGHIPFGTMSYSWFALLIQSDRTLLISGLFVAPSHWWPHLMGTALRGPQSDIVQKREAVKWMAQCIPQTHRTMCGRTRNSCLHCYLECMRIAHMYVTHLVARVI